MRRFLTLFFVFWVALGLSPVLRGMPTMQVSSFSESYMGNQTDHCRCDFTLYDANCDPASYPNDRFEDGQNLYDYVYQNPWTKFDPEGLWADSYSDWDSAANDAGAQGGVWGWTKAVGIELAKNTLNTLSMGNFQRNSAVAGQVASGKISKEDGELAVEGNTLVGVASVGAGGVAGKAVTGIGGGLAAGLAQSTTQVVGQHAVAAVTGTPQTSVSSDLKQIAVTTAVGGAFDAAAAGDTAIANNQLAKLAQSSPSASANPQVTPTVPDNINQTMDRIAQGGSNPHPNDGSVFQNRQGLLPQQPAGYYNEYVHPTPGINGPGPQRVVTGQGGEAYYTPDHYKSFTAVPQSPSSVPYAPLLAQPSGQNN